MRSLKIILRDTGVILIVVGVVTLFVILASLAYHEYEEIVWILGTSAIFVAIGVLFRICAKCSDEPRLRHTMITAAISWLIISVISAIPFYFLTKVDFLSALFESVSGWTGTGLSMYAKNSDLSHTILLYRSFTQWIGGVGVIILTLIVLARPGTGSYTLYRAEARDEKIKPNVLSTVKIMWRIFVAYTVIGIILLVIVGVPFWEALNHTMTAIATGGFSVKDDSIASYAPIAQLLIIGIMIVGAISFSSHYDFLKKNIKKFLKDIQTQALLLMIAGFSLLLAYINFNGGTYHTFIDALKFSVFQFSSGITTTGLQTDTNLSEWLSEAKLLLSLSMIVGGAAGSTAGGIKLIRFILLAKGAGWKLRGIFLPSKSAFRHKIGDKTISENEALELVYESAVISFLWIIMLIVGIFVVLHTTTGVSLENAVFEVCSAQGNTGLTVGVTSMGMNGIAKLMLIINMWVGRLEIIPFLVLLRGILKKGRIF